MPGGRAVPHAAGRGGVPAPQQETGQGEEHRDGQIEPVQQPADHPVGGASLEGDVGQDHPHRRAGTHALDDGQEAAGAPDPFRDRFHSSQCAGGSPERKSGYTVSRVTGGPGLLIEQRLNFCC